MLFLVVGPSGAGKDTLIDAARRALRDEPRFVFPQRAITRPADAGGEAHRAVDARAFALEEAAGLFALSWRAHGLAYGVPIAIEADLATGRDVVVNVSRAIVAEAVTRFARVRVIHVTVPADVLRARLAARGRESGAAQDARVARTATLPGGDVVEIVNDGTVADGTERLLAALQATENAAR